MFGHLELHLVSPTALTLYYLIVAMGGFYVLFRFGFTKLAFLMVLIFWEGLFSYFAEKVGFSGNYYKIAVTCYVGILFAPKIVGRKYENDKAINVFFICFSISFWITYLLYPKSIITISSQYAYKYGFIYLIYHGVKDIRDNNEKGEFIAELLRFIVLMQLFFSLLKVVFFGGFMEFIVGSVQYIGGGVAVTIPILGLLLLWLHKKGNFTMKDWMLAIALMFVGIASMKRTPILLFPIFLALLIGYVKSRVRVRRLMLILAAVPFLFYVGVKTNPSLTPERSFWGSFDLEYVYSYAMNYTFGSNVERFTFGSTAGRGGSLFLIFSPGALDMRSPVEVLFGHGLADVATEKYGRFLGTSYGMAHRGSLNGGAYLVYTLGYSGLITYLIFVFSIVRIIGDRKWKNVVVTFFLLEFLFYYNTTLTANSMATLFVFICLYSNTVFQEIGKGRKRPGYGFLESAGMDARRASAPMI